MKKLPSRVKGFNFYLGSDNNELFQAFANSVYPERLEHLCIGDSSYKNGNGLDYSEITEILSRINFPKLKSFEIGIWQLFCNEHCAYGKVGDLTKILANMPKLESLTYLMYFIVYTLYFVGF